MPIDWPEPFGLVMIEAMACGTPVVAFNRGSVPEIVDHGVTGFIVEDELEAVAAVDRIHTASRQVVRSHFQKRFTARRMALDYLDIYRNWRPDRRRSCVLCSSRAQRTESRLEVASLSTVSMTPQAQSRPPQSRTANSAVAERPHELQKDRLLLVRFAQKGWDAIDKVVQSSNSE